MTRRAAKFHKGRAWQRQGRQADAEHISSIDFGHWLFATCSDCHTTANAAFDLLIISAPEETRNFSIISHDFVVGVEAP